MQYFIEARGLKGGGKPYPRVIVPATGAVAHFPTRATAKAHRAEILDAQPSGYLPLVVVKEG